ncbi:MAG: Ribosomal RNA small subunit methyltransferase A [Tenericutes bacterium ADurb.BinA155]|jgi:16S rRNA (adenine1518-N6/adenine1519-N6)-dimethyltransferase|nr:MAG: Ribosomal RNA small subunit methyltransferase A [Tenericutes bacterium ADurb.BinA155]
MDKTKYFEGVASYKLLAKKEVGQNFLADPDVAARIVGLLNLVSEDHVLEIGSGAGSLSFFLAEGPAQSDLIDIDEALVTKLQHDFEGNRYVHPEMGNAMRFDYAPYTKIIGNLPYYITSGIMEKILLGAKNASRVVLMVQKEAADRLLAKPGSKEYSPLSLYLNYVATVKRAFNVARTSFVPAPHIESSVLTVDFIREKHDDESAAMYQLAEKLFLYRRKTILNNLKTYLNDGPKAEAVLHQAGIDPGLRPEDLSASNYLALLRALKC